MGSTTNVMSPCVASPRATRRRPVARSSSAVEDVVEAEHRVAWRTGENVVDAGAPTVLTHRRGHRELGVLAPRARAVRAPGRRSRRRGSRGRRGRSRPRCGARSRRAAAAPSARGSSRPRDDRRALDDRRLVAPVQDDGLARRDRSRRRARRHRRGVGPRSSRGGRGRPWALHCASTSAPFASGSCANVSDASSRAMTSMTSRPRAGRPRRGARRGRRAHVARLAVTPGRIAAALADRHQFGGVGLAEHLAGRPSRRSSRA